MFITQELRENAGQFNSVTDAKMIQVGVERKGKCQACQHEIKNHIGIYHKSAGFMWVGSKCAGILTADNTDPIRAEGEFKDARGREMVALSEAQFNTLTKIAWRAGVRNGREMARCYTLNEFVAGILRQAEGSPNMAISKNQFNCVKKYL